MTCSYKYRTTGTICSRDHLEGSVYCSVHEFKDMHTNIEVLMEAHTFKDLHPDLDFLEELSKRETWWKVFLNLIGMDEKSTFNDVLSEYYMDILKEINQTDRNEFDDTLFEILRQSSRRNLRKVIRHIIRLFPGLMRIAIDEDMVNEVKILIPYENPRSVMYSSYGSAIKSVEMAELLSSFLIPRLSPRDRSSYVRNVIKHCTSPAVQKYFYKLQTSL